MNLNSLQNQKHHNFVSQPLLVLPTGSKPHERLRTHESLVAPTPQNQLHSNFYLNSQFSSISQHLKTLKDNNHKLNRSNNEQKYPNNKKLITQIRGYNQPYKFGNSKDNTPFLTSKKAIARTEGFSSNRIFSADLGNKQQTQTSEINSSKQSLFFMVSNQKNMTDRQYNQHINKTLNDELQSYTPELKKSKTYKGTQLNQNLNQVIIGNKNKQEKHKQLDQYVTRVKNNNQLYTNMSPNRIIDKYRSLSPLHQNTENIYYQTNAVQSWKKNKLGELATIYMEHSTQTYIGIRFCLSLLPAPSHVIQAQKVEMLQYSPMLKYKKTVVFDLDETLVHCVEGQKQSDIKIQIQFPTGDQVEAGINLRAYARELLESLSQVCEVVLFTASHSCYASKVVEKLDPEKRLFSKVLFRDKCIVTQEGVYIKDIRVIGRDLKDIVLVDNATYSFGTFLNNGIPIIPFYDNKLDTELKSLQIFLFTEILNAYDVRPVLSKHFQLMNWMKFATAKDSVLNLYDS